jgi:squalene monooxygenase
MAEAAGVGQLGGAAVATLLAALFLAVVFLRQRRRRGAPVEGTPAPVDGCAVVEGSTAVDGPTDVIIVGAGVAGSALAYTLGKVALLLPFSFLPVLPFRSAG